MPNTADITIDLHDVHLAYRSGADETRVLRGAEFHAGCGETVLLMGPSGCGKSTLLSIVGCILRADRGNVNVLGQNVNALDDRGRAIFRRECIGFVFQRFHLIRGLSALDNIAVPLSLAGCPRPKAMARAKELLDAVELAEKSNATAQQLSAGQCQRIAIARALAADPAVILADEPTASLDAETGQTVMQLFTSLTKVHNKTLVVVTHDERIVSFADRICLMHNGQLREESESRQPEQAVAY